MAENKSDTPLADDADPEGDVEMCEEDSVLQADADTDHIDIEDWYDSLGWHINWQADHEDGEVVHPVCTVEQLRTMSDAEILNAACPKDASGEEREAYESAIDYARSALDAAESLVATLQAAVDAYESEDSDACIRALSDASRLENEYGDDPSVQQLANQLLVRGYNAIRSR